MNPSNRPRVVVWWEDLPIGLQFAVTLPLAVVAIWAVHHYAFALPSGRSFTYAGFWALLVTGLIVGSTRAERARREHRAAQQPPSPPDRSGEG